MKKVLFPILALFLALGLAVPMAAPAAASTTTITLVSSTATQTAGNTTINPLAGPLNPSNYSGLGTWSNAVAVGSPVIPPWVNPSTDPVFAGSGAVWVSTTAANYGNDNNIIGDSWRLFKAEFNIPAGAVVTSAQIWLTADNAFALYLHNASTLVGTTGYVYGAAPGPPYPDPNLYFFQNVYSYTFTPTAGLNTLYFVVRNWDNTGAPNNPTGLLYKAVIEYAFPEIEKTLVGSDPELTPDTNGNGIDEVTLGQQYTFTMDITVTNDTGVDLTNVLVHDRLGGELLLEEYEVDGQVYIDPSINPDVDGVTTWTRGKTAKWFIDWTIASLPYGGSETLTIVASLDQNPGGGKQAPHQEYSSPGTYDLNSGATIVSAEIDGEVIEIDIQTDPVSVECVYLVGNWELQYVQISPTPGPYDHDMTIDTENPDGSFSGTGSYPTGPMWTWNVTGTVTDGTVSMTITYDQSVGGTYPYIVSLTGTVGASGSSMSGTATDNRGHSYTWTATRVP